MQQQCSNGILLRRCLGVQNQNNMLLWFAIVTADCKCTTGDPVEAIAGLGLIDNWIVQSSNTISSSIAIHGHSQNPKVENATTNVGAECKPGSSAGTEYLYLPSPALAAWLIESMYCSCCWGLGFSVFIG